MQSILFLGASSDIAMATARYFAAKDFNIKLAGRDVEYLNRVKTDLEIRFNIDCEVYPFDALNFNTHAAFAKNLKSIPDITVCSFGYLGDQELSQSSWQETENILGTNLLGAISILNEIANMYEKNGNGTIIGISSVAGERGRKSNYTYGSAKAGFTAYLSGLRHRLFSAGVQVISIKPGFVRTKMTSHLNLPARLTSTPDEVGTSIFNATRKKRNIVYVKPIWRYIMLIIKLMPEDIFKRTKL